MKEFFVYSWRLNLVDFGCVFSKPIKMYTLFLSRGFEVLGDIYIVRRSELKSLTIFGSSDSRDFED